MIFDHRGIALAFLMTTALESANSPIYLAVISLCWMKWSIIKQVVYATQYTLLYIYIYIVHSVGTHQWCLVFMVMIVDVRGTFIYPLAQSIENMSRTVHNTRMFRHWNWLREYFGILALLLSLYLCIHQSWDICHEHGRRKPLWIRYFTVKSLI